jgi:hypothetical protein
MAKNRSNYAILSHSDTFPTNGAVFRQKPLKRHLKPYLAVIVQPVQDRS